MSQSYFIERDICASLLGNIIHFNELHVIKVRGAPDKTVILSYDVNVSFVTSGIKLAQHNAQWRLLCNR